MKHAGNLNSVGTSFLANAPKNILDVTLSVVNIFSIVNSYIIIYNQPKLHDLCNFNYIIKF